MAQVTQAGKVPRPGDPGRGAAVGQVKNYKDAAGEMIRQEVMERLVLRSGAVVVVVHERKVSP